MFNARLVFAFIAVLGLSTAPAKAATLIGLYSGNDCTGGFSNCYATQSGTNVVEGLLASPVVAKFNGSGRDDEANLNPLALSEISSHYSSITGNEFSLSFDYPSHTVSFSYSAGANDPTLHYFAIKQGRQYALYYDENPIINGSVDLDGVGFNAGSDSFSHISFFNGGPGAVPEPSTWAMMLLGFGAVGFSLRRRNRLFPIKALA